MSDLPAAVLADRGALATRLEERRRGPISRAACGFEREVHQDPDLAADEAFVSPVGIIAQAEGETVELDLGEDAGAALARLDEAEGKGKATVRPRKVSVAEAT